MTRANLWTAFLCWLMGHDLKYHGNGGFVRRYGNCFTIANYDYATCKRCGWVMK